MQISQQAFADAVVAHVEANPIPLDPKRHETQVPDQWTYRAEGQAMTGHLCLVSHGMFDKVYRRTVILPKSWKYFCEQFYSPEARLLMQLYHECEKPSWLTWQPEDAGRDDSPMTGHFWTHSHQERTYAALLDQLRARGLTTRPTQDYEDDHNAIGIKLPERVVDFPGSYRNLHRIVMELQTGDAISANIPRGIQKYSDNVPILHMIGNVVESKNDKLLTLIARNTDPKPKEQQVVYVFSERRPGKSLSQDQLIARTVGSMQVSVLEIAYGSVAGAIHSDFNYIVPNDLSPDEKRSYDCSRENWDSHSGWIIENCPALANSFSDAA